MFMNVLAILNALQIFANVDEHWMVQCFIVDRMARNPVASKRI